MATSGKNLSIFDRSKVPNGAPYRVAIAWAEWNEHITTALRDGAVKTLVEAGVFKHNIKTYPVPGSFELPTAALWLAKTGRYDAIITIGSVIQGETRHFEFVCQAVAQGVKDVGVQTGVPVIFCVLTDNTEQQAIDRSGGKHGNKGVEAAIAALQMADLRRSIAG
jgi:6,7-dimethyl-8-ribityllumazine synthase